MRSSSDKISQLDDSNHVESKPAKPRHLHIIKMIGDAKNATLNEPNDNDFPSPFPCPLFRARACAKNPQDPSVYIVKQSGKLKVDRKGVLQLEQDPRLLNLGMDPLSHMPMKATARQRFREELSSASQAFFQRSALRKITQESTSIENELKINNGIVNAVKPK